MIMHVIDNDYVREYTLQGFVKFTGSHYTYNIILNKGVWNEKQRRLHYAELESLKSTMYKKASELDIYSDNDIALMVYKLYQQCPNDPSKHKNKYIKKFTLSTVFDNNNDKLVSHIYELFKKKYAKNVILKNINIFGKDWIENKGSFKEYAKKNGYAKNELLQYIYETFGPIYCKEGYQEWVGDSIHKRSDSLLKQVDESSVITISE